MSKQRMSISVIVDNGNPKTGTIPEALAEGIIPVQALPLSSVTLTDLFRCIPVKTMRF